MNAPALITLPPLGDFTQLAERVVWSGIAVMVVLIMLSIVWEMLRKR